MTASVALTSVSKSFGPKRVLVDITFTLGPQTRMGFVGRNGSGKSTLLKLIGGVDQPDSGTIAYMPSSAAIGYLPQSFERGQETVDQFLLRRTGVADAASELERTAVALADATQTAYDEYELALDRYTMSGAADFEARAVTALKDVGLDEQFRSHAIGTLSGGQAAKASLASILLSRFDLLLLDEPTNDLDFRGLELLERFVVNSDAGMLMVSHDRAFVERTTNSILEIDEHHHTAREFGGGWEAYERERAAVRGNAATDFKNYEAQRSQLKQRAQQQRQWSEKGVTGAKDKKDNDKFVRNWGNEKSEKQAGKARTTEKALERLETVDKPWEGWELQMKLESAPRAGDVVAKLSNAVVRRGEFELGPINEEIGWAERIAIVGPNGSGKTTFLSALLGKLPLESGDQYVGPGVVVGEIDQLRTVLEADRPLADVFMEASGLLAAESRSLLAKFDLGSDHVGRAASSLSPGEQTRALLALLMSRGTNLLVLDEPTNHLDVDAIEQLEAALDTYDGTVLLITHDRRMLDAVTITRTITLG